MPVSRLLRLASSIVLMGLCGLLVATPRILARPAATTLPGNSIPSVASPPLPSPVPQGIPSPAEQFGHVVGADRKLVRWDGIVDYLRIVGSASDRVNVHEIGPTTQGRPFLLLEISSADTIANLDHYKQLQQRLYFQDHLPGQDPDQVHTPEQRRELIEDHKAVVLITCSIHATEVGAAQMSLELVYHLATDNSPQTRKILDNVIFLLVPSLNPDGQGMVTDWYNRHVGTDFEAGSMPWLYHPYVGHDNNRDAYMYTQQETRLIGQVLYKDWFPSIWLDEHQMGSTGPRIFVMPATDPININVHPLIYRLNGIYGQAQGAALEAAGKVGIIYDYTYTNFWEGAMAWTGWWHNQVGMLTEMASVRIATPTEQRTAPLGLSPSAQGGRRRGGFGQRNPDEPLPAPRDTLARTTYPRPWLGGTWTLRDIVEYELIASLGLLETAADTRRQLNEQIYEINRTTIAQFLKGQGGEEESGAESGQGEGGGSRQQGRRGQGGASQGKGYGPTPAAIEAQRADSGRVLAGFDGAGGTPYGIIVATDQHDPIAVAKMLQALERGGVIVERASADFEAGGKPYAAGTYVIRLAQVFGRYAKDMLEAQTYPEVRLAPGLPPQPPYDVTAWSLGMMMGVETTFVDAPFEALLEVVDEVPLPSGRLRGRGDTFLIDAVTNASFAAINRLWGERTRIRRATTPFEASG
ncbi:MAG: M14 metallopeptidase family protein, partial [Acidobacteriota bacterium]